MFNFRSLVMVSSLAFCSLVQAGDINIDVPMDYRLIRNVLVSQLYTAEGQTARVWQDGKQCSFLDLSDPQINGEDGQVRIDNHLHARIGAKLGKKCMPVIEWNGQLQTFQKPTLDASGSVLSFPVTHTNAYDQNGQALNIGQLQDLLKQVAEPQLANLKIDLNHSRDDIIKTLSPYVSADHDEQLLDLVNSLRFKQVKASDSGLKIAVGFTALKQKKTNKNDEDVFSNEEMLQWQAIWQNWRQSVEQSVAKGGLDDQPAETRSALQSVLNDAGSSFEAALRGEESRGSDPVRQFFNRSWDKMGPILRSTSKQLPGAEALRYLTLIAATDLIYQVESVTAPLGLEISSNGLRKLARNYLARQNERQGQG